MPRRTQYIQQRINSDRKRYYKYLKYPEIPIDINDLYVVTTQSDSLDLLANQFYGNVDYWWIIANANPGVVERDGFILKPGIEVRVPQNIQRILENFIEANK